MTPILNLELYAASWLVNMRNCMIVLREMCPRPAGLVGEPDVFGVTRARFCHEIEIKRSLADFHADKTKHCRRNRDFYPTCMTKYFWFCVPEELADKVNGALPPYAGLLACDDRGCVRVRVESPINKASKKLSIKECVQLGHQVSLYANRLDLRLHAATRGECLGEWTI